MQSRDIGQVSRQALNPPSPVIVVLQNPNPVIITINFNNYNRGNQSSGYAENRLRNLWDRSYALTLNTERNFGLKKRVIIVLDDAGNGMQYRPSRDPQTHCYPTSQPEKRKNKTKRFSNIQPLPWNQLHKSYTMTN